MTTNKPGSVNQPSLYGCTGCYEDYSWPAGDLRVYDGECWCDLCWDGRRCEFPDQPYWDDLEPYTPALLAERDALQAECEMLRKGKATGWVSVDDALPELGVPVWLKTGHSVFIGGRVDHPDGWLWGRCYYEPWINKDGEWEGEIECYDNHMVTAWHPLPVPPVTMTEDRA